MKENIDLTEERVFSSEEPERPQNDIEDFEFSLKILSWLDDPGEFIDSEEDFNRHRSTDMYDTKQICDCCGMDRGKIPWSCKCYSSTYTSKLPWGF